MINRFRHIGLKTRGERSSAIFGARVCSDRDCRNVTERRLEPAYAAQQRIAIQNGHRDVDDKHVRAPLTNLSKCRFGRIGEVHIGAALGQHGVQSLPLVRLVIDCQHANAIKPLAGCLLRPVWFVAPLSRGGSNGNSDRERRAMSEAGATCFHSSTVQFDNRPNDR